MSISGQRQFFANILQTFCNAGGGRQQFEAIASWQLLGTNQWKAWCTFQNQQICILLAISQIRVAGKPSSWTLELSFVTQQQFVLQSTSNAVVWGIMNQCWLKVSPRSQTAVKLRIAFCVISFFSSNCVIRQCWAIDLVQGYQVL